MWARETLLGAIGEAPADPIVAVVISDHRDDRTHYIDFRHVSAIRLDAGNTVVALLEGVWVTLVSKDPHDLVSRWARIHRGGDVR